MQIRRPICIIILLLLLIVVCVNCRGTADSSLDILESEGKIVSLEGIVKSKEYKLRFGQETLVVLLEPEKSDGQDVTATYQEKIETQQENNRQQVMCYMKVDQQEPYIGQKIVVRGRISLFSKATNSGEFDSQNYYQILKISYKLTNTEILSKSKTFSILEENLYRVKRMLSHAIDRCFTEKEAGVVKAMVLGDKSTLDTELKDLYQLSGIVHILAISGLHISLLGMGVYRLLHRCMLPKIVRIPVVMLSMILYGMMTGMGTSCFRAIFMFGLKLLAELVGRSYDIVSALAIVGIGILWQQPLYLRHSGFLLSFGAVFGLVYVLPWLQDLFRIKYEKTKEKGIGYYIWCLKTSLRDGVLAGLAITITTLPIQLYFYYVYPITSLVLNLLVIPLMGLLLADEIVAMIYGFAVILYEVTCLSVKNIEMTQGIVEGGYGVDRIGQILALPGEVILHIYEAACEFSMKIPHGVFVIGKPMWWQIAAYYAVLLALLLYPHLNVKQNVYSEKKILVMKRELPPYIQLQLLLIALCFLCRNPRENMRIHFLDVGQGDCIVMVNDNGNAYMVDGGSTSKQDVGTYQIVPFLKSQGIGELEAVFLTHPDEDHMSGIVELLEDEMQPIVIKRLILPDICQELKNTELIEIRTLAHEKEVPVYYMHRGEQIQDEELHLISLNPVEHAEAEDINEISQVLYVKYEDFKMLLTGDVTGEPEKQMVRLLEGINVLKVAHHGSRFSTPKELLDIIQPKYSIISAGKENSYGHPHEETLQRLSECGSVILSTSENGAITVEVGRTCRIQGWKYQ